MTLHWQEDKSQRAWLWVGPLFLLFYFGEALLFWGPKPRIVGPSYTPLVYWGVFGLLLIVLVTLRVPGAEKPTRLEKVQAWLLGLVITAAVVGSAFLVIRRTQDLTLGHGMLLWTLGQCGLIVGILTLNPGWGFAGLVWGFGAAGVFLHPAVQDYTVGASVGLGFLMIGLLRKNLRETDRPV